MKRALCLALLGVAVFSSGAGATEAYVVKPYVSTDHGVFVGAAYSRDGGKTYDPIGGASVNTETGRVCAGLSYQIPFCVGGPVS